MRYQRNVFSAVKNNNYLIKFSIVLALLFTEIAGAQDTSSKRVMTRADSSAVSTLGIPKISKKAFNYFGDFRVRVAEDLRSSSNRFRGRFRIRVGMGAKITTSSHFNLRLISTDDVNDPNSSHVNINSGFNQIKIALDQAYFYVNPHQFSSFKWWLGKFSNPMASSKIFSELVWDIDVQLEGSAFSLSKPLGKKGKVNLINGTYLLSQFKTDNRKNWLNTSQVSIDWQLSESWSLSLVSGFYYFANIEGQEVVNTLFGENENNSTLQKMQITGSDSTFTTHYKTDFHLLDNFALLKFKGLSMPLLFKFQWIHNFGAAAQNQGYAAGFSYGDLKDKNHWTFYYQYSYLQQDAIFTPFTQDDFLRRTKFRGHAFGMAYAFHKKIALHASGLLDTELNEEVGTQARFRLDFNVKF